MHSFSLKPAFACALVFAATFIPCVVNAELLRPGQSIGINQRLHSDYSRYFVTLHENGRFVLYRYDGRALWEAPSGASGAVTANMQHDGNFVLYNGAGQAVWSTRTQGPHRAFGIDNEGRVAVLKPRKKKFDLARYNQQTTFMGLVHAGGVMEWNIPKIDGPHLWRVP